MQTVFPRRLGAVALALTVTMGAVPAAHAAPQNPSPAASTISTMSDQHLEEITKEAFDLEASSIPRHMVNRNGVDFIVYELDTGVNLAMPAYLTRPTPRVNAGTALAGPWVELTPLDQKALFTGATAGVAAAICAGTAGIACGASAAIAAAASTYVSEKGVCPNDQRLLLELTWGNAIRGASCR